jgi:Beta-lactamase superfamily domain
MSILLIILKKMKRKAFINKILALSLSTLDGKESRKKTMSIVTSYTSNPKLKTILEGWQGTPLDQNGRFVNHQFPFVHSFGTALKWMLQTNPQKAEKKADTWQKQVLTNTHFLNHKGNCIVWLGHASFYIQLAGKKILIDPVFEGVTATKRLTKLPVAKESFRDLDYVLVSHAHYDHCDKDSLKLLAKLNPKAQFFAGLNLHIEVDRPTHTNGWLVPTISNRQCP